MNTSPIIQVLFFTLALSMIFLGVYLPLEKIARGKAWYHKGLYLIAVAIILSLYTKFLAGPIDCWLNPDDIKCGVGHSLYSLVLALFFCLMGLIWLIKEKYFKK